MAEPLGSADPGLKNAAVVSKMSLLKNENLKDQTMLLRYNILLFSIIPQCCVCYSFNSRFVRSDGFYLQSRMPEFNIPESSAWLRGLSSCFLFNGIILIFFFNSEKYNSIRTLLLHLPTDNGRQRHKSILYVLWIVFFIEWSLYVKFFEFTSYVL